MILFPSTLGWASTVGMTDYNLLGYVAAPGESNAVVVTLDASTIRFSDPGATISVGTGCVLDGADAVCEHSDLLEEVFVQLGDGDDSAALSSAADAMWAFVGFDGGPGNDRLTGGLWFHGREGDDELILSEDGGTAYGGPGNDTFRGGAGSDFFDGGAGDDIIDGGGGFDHLYAQARNLWLTPTALVGQGSDSLSNIEYAYLYGDSRRNVIDARAWPGGTEILTFGGNDAIVGGLGRDYVEAGLGNDWLAGGAGRDYLAGEVGADVLRSRDGERDRLYGGKGRDRARIDSLDFRRGIEAFFG
jgi:Ca2+-binding RTX toxin-like protein